MLSRLGTDLWIVRVPLRFLGLQVGRNMASCGWEAGLVVHCPAPLTPTLRAALDELGPVRFVVSASALHGHRFMEQ